MLKNILALEKQRIGDLMVPRADIVAVQKDIAIGQLLRVFASAAHSRLVVYDDTLDDPTGMVHIRDLVAYLTGKAAATSEAAKRSRLPADLDPRAVDLSEKLSSTQIVRPILFVPPSMPAIDLLVKMQATRIHLALVIDEYGGTDGLVSIEDIVEQIVGDIEDEHDEEITTMIVAQGDGGFIADARASLDEAAEKIGPAFAAGEDLEDVDTLGGLLVTLAGRVPVRGEIIAGPGEFEIEVLDADPRRAKRLRIGRRPPEVQRREARRRGADEAVSVAPSLPKSETAGPTARSPEESGG
jgi:CBS domain containing-hemolysin-like protein